MFPSLPLLLLATFGGDGDQLVLRGASGAFSYSVCFSPDGAFLAGTDRGEVVVWDARTGKEALRKVALADAKDFRDYASAVAFSSDGTRLACATRGGLVRVWDVKTGKEVRGFEPRLGPLIAVAFVNGDKSVATVTGIISWAAPKHEIRVRDVATGRDGLVIHPGDPAVMAGSASFSADGRFLAVANSTSHTLTLWDMVRGKPAFQLKEDVWGAPAFSRDGKRLACHVRGEGIVVWETDTVRAVRRIPLVEANAHVQALAFTPDGKRLAAVCSRLVEDDTGRVEALTALHAFDLATGKETLRRDLKERVWILAFSPDGSRLALAADGIEVWKDWER